MVNFFICFLTHKKAKKKKKGACLPIFSNPSLQGDIELNSLYIVDINYFKEKNDFTYMYIPYFFEY